MRLVLDAVGVEVVPDEVAEGGGLIEPCVDGHIGIAGGQGVLGGDAGGGIGVRVGGVTTHILGAEGIAAGIDEFDAVGAWGKAREEVGTAGVCGGGGEDGGSGGTEQVDGDACDAGCAIILDAVGVEVIPDEVAEGGELIEPCVDGHIGIAGGQGVLGGDAGGGIGVRVGGVTTHILGAEGIAAGIDEFDAVGAWGKAREEVGTAGVCGGGGEDGGSGGTEQVDGDA